MSFWSKGFFAVCAACLALGGVHLEIASGGDLTTVAPPTDAGTDMKLGREPLPAFLAQAAPSQQAAPSHEVNRSSKGDRLGHASPGLSGPTMVFTVAGLPNTSVVTFAPLEPVSVPVGNSNAAPGAARAIMRTAACEPPVSALTEVARRIQIGRCIT